MSEQNNNYKWYHKAVVYHIYTRSFKDSNNDGVGDLEGIIQKLDYLNNNNGNSLGVGAIWLSPFYKSPQADYGYDVSNYRQIDPVFGNLEIFDRLVAECKKRDIRILIDFVINHTSKEHLWFKESRSAKDNPKRDWYIWKDPSPEGGPPNNWISVFGGSAWEYDIITGQYYFHSFLPEQPDLNWRSEEVQNEMKEVARFWLRRGVDGFRIDAIEHLLEDSYLRNDPVNPDFIPFVHDPYRHNEPLFSKNQKDLNYCIDGLCEVMGEFEDKFIVSEAYVDIPKIISLYRACSQKVHAPFNFNLMYRDWSALEYKKFINEFEQSLSVDDWPNYVFGNHDRPRLVSRLGEERAKIVATLLLTLRGMPFIYYGDEIGMTDVGITSGESKDRFAKRAGDIKLSRDPQRSPMQWSDGKNAGFSEAEPWLPIASDFKKKNVEVELGDPDSILNLYRALINFRNETPALQYGSYKSLDTDSPDIFSYVREYGNEKILIMLNFSDRTIEEPLPFSSVELICSTFPSNKKEKIEGKLTLLAYEGCVMKITNNL